MNKTYKEELRSEIGILTSRLETLQKQESEHKDLTKDIDDSKEVLLEIDANIKTSRLELIEVEQKIRQSEMKILSLKTAFREWEENLITREKEIIKLDKTIESKTNSIEALKAERKTILLAKNKEEKELIEAKIKWSEEIQELLRSAEWEKNKIESAVHNAEKELEEKKLQIEKQEKLREQAKEQTAEQEEILHNKIMEVVEIENRIEAFTKKEQILKDKNLELAKIWAEQVRKNKQVEALIIENELLLNN